MEDAYYQMGGTRPHLLRAFVSFIMFLPAIMPDWWGLLGKSNHKLLTNSDKREHRLRGRSSGARARKSAVAGAR